MNATLGGMKTRQRPRASILFWLKRERLSTINQSFAMGCSRRPPDMRLGQCGHGQMVWLLQKGHSRYGQVLRVAEQSRQDVFVQFLAIDPAQPQAAYYSPTEPVWIGRPPRDDPSESIGDVHKHS